jgi:hypothetical protein
MFVTLFIVDGIVTVLNLGQLLKALDRFVTLDHPLGIIMLVIEKQLLSKDETSTAPTVVGKVMFVSP